jgi:hypothetical protein
VLDYLMKTPPVLTFGDDNFRLRELWAGMVGEPMNASKVLWNTSRKKVEAEVASMLGHPDLSKPVPPGDHAKRVLLRALIQTGMVKGESEPQR